MARTKVWILQIVANLARSFADGRYLRTAKSDKERCRALRAVHLADGSADFANAALSVAGGAEPVRRSALQDWQFPSAALPMQLRSVLKPYLRMILGPAREECLIGIFLDRRGRFIGEEILSIGTPSNVALPINRVSLRAIELGAHSVILAHNHPSGFVEPSRDDRQATVASSSALAAINVNLLDHLIVTADRVFSIRQGAIL